MPIPSVSLYRHGIERADSLIVLFGRESIARQTLKIALLSRETVSLGYGADVGITTYLPAPPIGSNMAAHERRFGSKCFEVAAGQMRPVSGCF